MATQAHYYRVRPTGDGSDESPFRPDLPASYLGGWVGNLGGAWWLVMCDEEVSVGDGRGSVVPIPNLPSEAQARGVPFAEIRDLWSIGGVHHPERSA